MNKGICKLSEIPVRKETASSSEMVSMLLFGETYHILEESGEWIKIRMDNDGYEGWINAKQHTSLLNTPSQVLVNRTFPALQAISGSEVHYILPGSLLPDTNKDSFAINGQQFSAPINHTGPFEKITDAAMMFLNAPYLWGGRSLFGIDCSGFTQVAFKLCGISLLRDAKQQATQGEEIPFRESVEAGDLAFFDNEHGVITHVGIMLSPDQIIHASGRVKIDSIDQFGIMDADKKEYSHKLRIIKRIR